MQIYFAETSFGMIKNKYVPYGVKNFLISFWYEKKPSNYHKFKEEHPEVNVMVDSGAFTADTKGVYIDLEDYTEFCLEIQDSVDVIITLDVIGNAQKSKENYDFMRNKGVKKLMPAFHQGEPYDILEYYCKTSDYIGIGALVGMHLRQRQLFNLIHNILDRIPPDIKVHLLGVSSPSLMYRFADRVFSVDSTSVSTKAAYTNRTMTMSGMPRNLSQGYSKASRINTEQVWILHQLNLMAQLRLEKEINDYVESKKVG